MKSSLNIEAYKKNANKQASRIAVTVIFLFMAAFVLGFIGLFSSIFIKPTLYLFFSGIGLLIFNRVDIWLGCCDLAKQEGVPAKELHQEVREFIAHAPIDT